MNSDSNEILRSDNNRNSFDRFSVGLCEEILQYLSFEDKIRFECVSKQWKRCVYQRQYVLETNFKPIGHPMPNQIATNLNLLPTNKLYSYPDIPWDFESDLMRLRKPNTVYDEIITNFERILMKCTKINCIRIDTEYMTSQYMSLDWLLRVIINNCNHLTEFGVKNRDHRSVYTVFMDFGVKFGNTLQNIKFKDCAQNTYRLIETCANITSISGIDVKYLISDGVTLKKLREVRVLKGCDDSHSMATFVTKYANSIKVFDAYKYDGYRFIFSQLSKLTKLSHLGLYMRISPANLPGFATALKSLASNRKLKHLRLYVSNLNQIDCTLLLDAINCLTELQAIELRFPIIEPTISAEVIKNCKQLKVLSVYANQCYNDPRFFANTGEYFPNLKVFRIGGFGGESEKTFNCFPHLTDFFGPFDRLL